MNVVRNIMEKQSGVETYEYRGMTWEVYHDELPLIIEDFMTVDSKIWQADEAYREYRGDEPQNRFLICWGNKLVEIAFDTFEDGITDEIISIVAEKLKDF